MQNLQETGWDTVCLKVSKLPRLQRTELPVLQLVSPSNRPIQISNLPKKGISKNGPKTGPAERRYQSRSYKTGGPVQIVSRADRHRQTPLNSEKTLFCERGGCLHKSVGKTFRKVAKKRTNNEPRTSSFWAIPAPSQSCTGAFSTQ